MAGQHDLPAWPSVFQVRKGFGRIGGLAGWLSQLVPARWLSLEEYPKSLERVPVSLRGGLARTPVLGTLSSKVDLQGLFSWPALEKLKEHSAPVALPGGGGSSVEDWGDRRAGQGQTLQLLGAGNRGEDAVAQTNRSLRL